MKFFGDVGLAITYNFQLRFFYTLYLLPISYDDSLHEWLVHVRVSITSVVLPYLSEFRLIRPLRWDFRVTLTHNKVNRIASIFISESTFFNYYRRVLSTFSRWASKVYPLFGQSHTKLITPRTSQKKFQRTMSLLSLKTYNIYVYKFPKYIFFYFFFIFF